MDARLARRSTLGVPDPPGTRLSKNEGTHDPTINRRHGGPPARAICPRGWRSASTASMRKIGEGGMGVGLRGRPAGDRQARRDQGAGAAHRLEPRAGAPLRRRGARRQQDRPPQHRRHLLVRVAARRAPLLRDGVPRGREPGRSPEAQVRSSPTRRGGCCDRSARRWRRRTGRASSTAISSPTTSGSCSRSTGTRTPSCSTSASPS